MCLYSCLRGKLFIWLCLYFIAYIGLWPVTTFFWLDAVKFLLTSTAIGDFNVYWCKSLITFMHYYLVYFFTTLPIWMAWYIYEKNMYINKHTIFIICQHRTQKLPHMIDRLKWLFSAGLSHKTVLISNLQSWDESSRSWVELVGFPEEVEGAVCCSDESCGWVTA